MSQSRQHSPAEAMSRLEVIQWGLQVDDRLTLAGQTTDNYLRYGSFPSKIASETTVIGEEVTFAAALSPPVYDAGDLRDVFHDLVGTFKPDDYRPFEHEKDFLKLGWMQFMERVGKITLAAIIEPTAAFADVEPDQGWKYADSPPRDILRKIIIRVFPDFRSTINLSATQIPLPDDPGCIKSMKG